MGHRTLTVSDEAYTALARLKQERESFTDVIIRLTSRVERGSLLDYIRSLEPNEELAAAVEKVSEERDKIVVNPPPSR